MFTVIWFPSESARNPTFEPTFALERPSDLPLTCLWNTSATTTMSDRLNFLMVAAPGGSPTRSTLDFHLGFGLNSSTVDHYFGVGYSLRLDGLFAGAVRNSP